MKLVATLLPFLISSYAFFVPAEEGIVGTYRFETGKFGDSLEIVLSCVKKNKCTFTWISKNRNAPYEDKRVVRVTRVSDLTDASTALKYAIAHQEDVPRTKDALEAMRQLRPTLSSNPVVSKCWDLNYPSSEHMLVCALTNTPADLAPIFLFSTLLGDCNDVFCRYLILPMSRENDASPEDGPSVTNR